jgi:hypothetical protein
LRSEIGSVYLAVIGREFKSKNDLAVEMFEVYPASKDELVYVLMDSWYTSEKVVNACNAKGFHIIAAFKTNRTICPQGIRNLDRVNYEPYVLADLVWQLFRILLFGLFACYAPFHYIKLF